MDVAKCVALKRDLDRQPEPQIVPIVTFFDGNDDLASIGCNLMEHPGIETFAAILGGLLRRSDVKAVYAQIAELDPGDDFWPFTDTVIVIGSIATEELQAILAPLQPDEVGPVDAGLLPPALSDDERRSALIAWWD